MPLAEDINTFRNTTIDLKYTLQGPAGGPVVVFIPGLGSQLVQLTYNTLVGPLINRSFRVLRIENRDAGHSTMVTGYDAPSIAKGITANIMNPATDKDSPIFFDTNKPVEQQQFPPLFRRGMDPHAPKSDTKPTDDDVSLPLGEDYNVFRGFQPRDAVYEAIVKRRQSMLDNIKSKRTPTSTNPATSPKSGEAPVTGILYEEDLIPDTGDGEEKGSLEPGLQNNSSTSTTTTLPNRATIPNSPSNSSEYGPCESCHADGGPGRSPSTVTRILNSMKPEHDLYDNLTTTHRAPIAALYEQFYYAKESNRISRSYESLYCLSEMAVDAILLINRLGISDFHIIGSSMGGFIATWIASLVPNRILSLTMVMSGTGTSGTNPDFFYLVRNLLRSRPPPPPFPKIKTQSKDENLSTADLRLDVEAGKGNGKQGNTNKENVEKKVVDEKKAQAAALKQYKSDLKEFNNNLKTFNAYVDFLVETNAIVGTPSIDPITKVPKTYNNGRAVRDHVKRWCSRAPFARGYQNQSGAIVSSPCRDSLLFFLAQHFPVFIAHGSADELVPVGSAHHSFNLVKGALDHVAPREGEEGGDDGMPRLTPKITSTPKIKSSATTPITTTTTTTTTTTPIQDEIGTETIQTQSTTIVMSEPSAPVTDLEPFVKEGQNRPESAPTALNGEDDKDVTKSTTATTTNTTTTTTTLPPKIPLREQQYRLDNDRAEVTRVVGYNRHTKIWLQHRKLIITGAKHEIVDAFTKYFVPQLVLHLEQAQTGESKSLTKIPLETIKHDGDEGLDQEPPEFQPAVQYEDQDLCFGIEDDELEYYDPDALPPPPPTGYTLVMKKGQYLVMERSKVKPGQEEVDYNNKAKMMEEHPEFILSPEGSQTQLSEGGKDDNHNERREGSQDLVDNDDNFDQSKARIDDSGCLVGSPVVSMGSGTGGSRGKGKNGQDGQKYEQNGQNEAVGVDGSEIERSYSVVAEPSNQEDYLTPEEKEERAKELKEKKEREQKEAKGKEREDREREKIEKENAERAEKEAKKQKKEENGKTGFFGRLKVKLLGSKSKDSDDVSSTSGTHTTTQHENGDGKDKDGVEVKAKSNPNTPPQTQAKNENVAQHSLSAQQLSHHQSHSQLSLSDVEPVEQPQYDS